MKTTQTITTDVLVIGGGGAGLRAAIKAREYDLNVLLVSKALVGYRNNTAVSWGVFAATGIWRGAGDSPDVHFKDVILGGRSINDQKIAKVMTHGATQQVYDLMKFGVNFEKLDGDLGGNACPRAYVSSAC
ncbi:unnamed protein product [marine sediment metagenome]|uniref:FAD-dependent oxidoreductase 2 FAD-binding domain-containing protein n=1 Tax=marine sediment metagenome TaxID=412755 RepID=X1M571_9ZZZZ